MSAEPREGRRDLFALLADGEHPIELRYRVTADDWRKAWAATPADADEQAARLTVRGHDVYVGLLPRFGRSGDAQRRYAPGRVLWAECDTARASRKLLLFEPTPTAVVLSGGIDGDECKRHGYWLLDRPMSPGEIHRHVLRLTRHLEADEASCDAARVLRVPGSRSHKTGRVARLESFTGESHPLDDLTGHLPDDEPERDGGRIASDDGHLIPYRQRHAHLMRFAGLLRSCGLREQTIVECGLSFLRHEVEQDPPMDLEHAERNLRGAARWGPTYTRREER